MLVSAYANLAVAYMRIVQNSVKHDYLGHSYQCTIFISYYITTSYNSHHIALFSCVYRRQVFLSALWRKIQIKQIKRLIFLGYFFPSYSLLFYFFIYIFIGSVLKPERLFFCVICLFVAVAAQSFAPIIPLFPLCLLHALAKLQPITSGAVNSLFL